MSTFDTIAIYGKKKDEQFLFVLFCVGVTYLPGPSPDKYFRQKRA